MIYNVQAMEWKKGFSSLTTGSFSDVVLVSCIDDGVITAHFTGGDEDRSFIAGEDRTLNNVGITIVSGTFDINVK